MKNYNSKFVNLLEDYKSILLKKRMFYPRKFVLSDDFTKALKKEVSRLQKEGMNKEKIVNKLSKALHFLLNN